MAAKENYILLIRDNSYALAKLQLEPEQRTYLREQRARWQFIVECLDQHMMKWTVEATRQNGGPLPF